ncbi:MAG: bifunctional (p)ppGpp synthetase/guanosine-3',5'-bis(diphosphate) 3'-pyrophosphohydrolase, partial [Bacteroidales bacterium]|nr:bifunctional (p)ppGpp synthetase/guanosine-3',5'-bis(diphosphate) 3'-pyrophosphohydrolase [Bacteroidales bacterium]
MLKKTEETQVQNLYTELIESVKKILSKQDEAQIRQAFEFAEKHLKGNYDEEGVARIIHNLQVAIIVADQIGLGVRTVICALLHNLPKEGNVSLDEIKREFGEQITSVIEGYRKISDLRTHRTAFQSENFRKLLLSLSGDVRVILLRLADRLQKMREVDYKDPERQQIYAIEAKHLYIPLAHRLGIYNIKTELEERVMKYMETDIYRDIAKKLKDTKSEREKFIKEFISPIESEIKKLGIAYELKGRPKSIHSIWNKMRVQKVGFEEVYDKFAIRIIIDSDLTQEKADCWSVYSIVTNIYQPNPKRMRDWISAPKDTGYESLHATVVGPNSKWVEVQIRTNRMDEVAEKGHAAHWRYKENKTGQSNEDWLARIRNILENPEPEVLDKTDEAKMELYTDNIFVFTPKGDIKKLTAGATVLDFAFSIHSNIGSQCVGAKVNDKNVPIRHQLQNGDQIEIITSKKQKPTRDWINLVASSRSKQRIKRLLKEEEFKEANAGKEILLRKFSQAKVKFNDPNLNAVIDHFGFKKPIDLYMALV